MEPISAVATFVTIAEVLKKVYKKLRKYARSLSAAAVEARDLAKEIRAFRRLLLLTETTLASLREGLKLHEEFVRNERLQYAGARDLIEELQEVVGDLPLLLNAGQQSLLQRWRTRHQWVGIQNELRRLQCSVERSKSSLTLFVNIVQLVCLKKCLVDLERQNGTDRLKHAAQVQELRKRM